MFQAVSEKQLTTAFAGGQGTYVLQTPVYKQSHYFTRNSFSVLANLNLELHIIIAHYVP
jgi:hypothetical protein